MEKHLCRWIFGEPPAPVAACSPLTWSSCCCGWGERCPGSCFAESCCVKSPGGCFMVCRSTDAAPASSVSYRRHLGIGRWGDGLQLSCDLLVLVWKPILSGTIMLSNIAWRDGGMCMWWSSQSLDPNISLQEEAQVPPGLDTRMVCKIWQRGWCLQGEWLKLSALLPPFCTPLEHVTPQGVLLPLVGRTNTSLPDFWREVRGSLAAGHVMLTYCFCPPGRQSFAYSGKK